MTIFRVHYTENSEAKVKDVTADTAEQAREIVKPRGSQSPIIILKAKVLRS